LIAALLQKFEESAELETQEHEVLIDTEVVYDVPVLIEDVEEGLEPLLLPLSMLPKAFHYIGDLDRRVPLVSGLVRVPEHCKG